MAEPADRRTDRPGSSAHKVTIVANVLLCGFLATAILSYQPGMPKDVPCLCCPARSIPTTLPATLTVGGHQPLNNFGDLLREEISRAGYTEMLTHGLCSRDENFKVLRLDRDVLHG